MKYIRLAGSAQITVENAIMRSNMDRNFLEKQRNLALQRLKELEDKGDEKKKAVVIVSEYLSSLLNPDNFTDAQKEDLRKLALELGYKEDTAFFEWLAATARS